jgi:glycosyltransferase involved in cell wall biosynthesis
VSGLARALARLGVEAALWAPDGSAERTAVLPRSSPVGRLTGTAGEALGRFRPDLVHDNGLWRPHHHRLAVLAARRGMVRLVSPRGMLEPWALRHKPARKKAAWWLYQRRDLCRALALHATCQEEARSIGRLGIGEKVVVIANGVDLPGQTDDPFVPGRAGPSQRPRTALFLGRLHPKKGIRVLIAAWDRVRPVGWRLTIAGPDEGGHRADIEAAVAACGLAEAVDFPGELDAGGKRRAYARADLLVLPTHSENFALVVAEALAHGVPVLTTTGAPWPMLGERGCGWWVAPTVDGIADGLRQATSLDAGALAAMGERGRRWMAADFGWDAIASRFLALYQRLLDSRRPPPAC